MRTHGKNKSLSQTEIQRKSHQRPWWDEEEASNFIDSVEASHEENPIGQKEIAAHCMPTTL